jgi:molybdopterin-binding protein
MVSRDSADQLRLAQGMDVLVLSQETSVIIGVA